MDKLSEKKDICDYKGNKKKNPYPYFIVFSPVKVETATCRWLQEGNSLVQTQYDVIKSQSSAQAASRHSRPHLLLFDSNLFLSLRLVSLVPSAESSTRTLVHVFTLKIVDDQVEFLVYPLRAQSHLNTPLYLPAHSACLKTGSLNPVESIADKKR